MSSRITLAGIVSVVPWPWLAALAVVSLLSLGTYAGIQQVLRSDANDPQIQLAQDAAARLARGEEPGAVLPAGHVDVSRSLAPWVVIARTGGGVVAANGELEGGAPMPPAGVLDFAERHGGNRVTWQPAAHVRVALVVVPVGGRPGLVVMAGRSLREVEERVDRIGRISLLAWAGSIGVVVFAWVMTAWVRTTSRAARASLL